MAKGQIEITFHWFYVLIAGAVILLFFLGLVIQQKASSEERLSTEVVRLMESIFTAAEVSEKTKNFIDTSGLSDKTFYFDCEQGTGSFGIKEGSYRSENPVTPVFAPAEIQAPELITWSLPYHLPFKAADLLLVTSKTTKYVLKGERDFIIKFMNSTEGLNREYVLEEIPTSGGETKVRLVDVGGTTIVENSPAPAVESGVILLPGEVVYYTVANGRWKRTGSVPLITFPSDKSIPSSQYAAMITEDAQSYTCNMKKTFQRLSHVTEIYQRKAQELTTYYTGREGMEDCLAVFTDPQLPITLNRAITNHLQILQGGCLQQENDAQAYQQCAGLSSSAEAIAGLNKQLQEKGCVALY